MQIMKPEEEMQFRGHVGKGYYSSVNLLCNINCIQGNNINLYNVQNTGHSSQRTTLLFAEFSYGLQILQKFFFQEFFIVSLSTFLIIIKKLLNRKKIFWFNLPMIIFKGKQCKLIPNL